MAETILLHAGNRSDGSRLDEEILVQRVGAKRYRIMRSPGLVLGLAAGDVIDVDASARSFVLIQRGMSFCVQVFRSADSPWSALEKEVTPQVAQLGGTLDGCAPKLLVYTVPSSVGLQVVSDAFSALVSRFENAEFYVGNDTMKWMGLPRLTGGSDLAAN